jgi:uncharacterized membrane protein
MLNPKTLAIIFILLNFALAIYFYPQLPDQLASHWNSNGEVDSYMSRDMGTFLLPVMAVAIYLLMLYLPRLDPLKKNYKQFQSEYDSFILVMSIFFTYIYTLTIVFNLGFYFNMSQAVPPVMSLLFLFIANLMKKSKRNWFVGIRNPWTLSSEKVWNKTHKLGSLIFKLFAVVFLFPMFIPNSMTIVITILLAGVTGLFIYSYMEYKKENA